MKIHICRPGLFSPHFDIRLKDTNCDRCTRDRAFLLGDGEITRLDCLAAVGNSVFGGVGAEGFNGDLMCCEAASTVFVVVFHECRLEAGYKFVWDAVKEGLVDCD